MSAFVVTDRLTLLMSKFPRKINSADNIDKISMLLALKCSVRRKIRVEKVKKN
jgi:hypothetical protein